MGLGSGIWCLFDPWIRDPRSRIGFFRIPDLGSATLLCTYDLNSPVHNVLDACKTITWGSGRVLGPGILEFFRPQMALAYQLDAIS